MTDTSSRSDSADLSKADPLKEADPKEADPKEADSSENTEEARPHAHVRRAAEGILPRWAVAGEARREHMARVADVLEGWARALGLEPADVIRWRAVGFLHDALRDAGGDELRALLSRSGGSRAATGDRPASGREGAVGGEGRITESPGWSVDWGAFALDRVEPEEGIAPVTGSLHGPVAALSLAGDGVGDVEILSAVAYHTVGHPDLGPPGRALYCADFVEPGRSTDPERRGELRSRYPDDRDGVLRDVLRARVGYLLERGRPVFLGTARMWNALNRTDR